MNSRNLHDDEVRRNARLWRDEGTEIESTLRSVEKRKRRASSVCRNRETERKNLWDNEGNLISDNTKCVISRKNESFSSMRSSTSLASQKEDKKPEWSLNTKHIEYTDACQLPKPKKRSSSVTRESQRETSERLSAPRKRKVEEKPKRPVNLDFTGFLQRQLDSTKARIEAMKPKEEKKAEISAGSRAILRNRNTRSIMDDTLEPKQHKEVEAMPSKTINETSKRLVNMDLAVEAERKDKKRGEILQKIIADKEQKEQNAAENQKPVKRAPLRTKKHGEQTVAQERINIEKRAAELQVIVDEHDKEKWVKPNYGYIPDYIVALNKAIPREKRLRSSGSTVSPRRQAQPTRKSVF